MRIIGTVLRSLLLGATVLLGIAASAATAAPSSSVIGTWEGTMEIASKSYRMVWHFALASDGRLGGTFDSPDSGVSGFVLDKVTFDNGTLVCEVTAFKGRYEGKLQNDGKTIVGTWSQAGLTEALPHTISLVSSATTNSATNRSQEPVKPYPYDEEEVSYQGANPGIKIAGTLTKPKTGGPFPVVLLIAGSDRTNRNEEVAGAKHKPFLVLADDLTRRGFAVLRFDKRGVGASTGIFETALLADFVDDALAGVAYLKSRKDIEWRRIGLIGHSEGGLIAPAVAVRSKDVAYVVMLGATGLPGVEAALLQNDRMSASRGIPDAVRQFQGVMLRQMFEIVQHESNSEAALPRLAEVWEAKKSEAMASTMTKSEKSMIVGLDAPMKSQLKLLATPAMRDKLNYDAASVLRRLQCAVLAISGEFDVYSPPKENLAAIGAALKLAGNKDYTVTELPGINHFLQAGKVAQLSSGETIDSGLLNLVGTWVMQHSVRK